MPKITSANLNVAKINEQDVFVPLVGILKNTLASPSPDPTIPQLPAGPLRRFSSNELKFKLFILRQIDVISRRLISRTHNYSPRLAT